MKRFTIFTVAILNYVGTGLITTFFATGSFSIPASITRWALPLGLASSDITLLLPLATAASLRSR